MYKLTKSQFENFLKEAVKTELEEQTKDWWIDSKGILTDSERTRVLIELYQRGEVDRANNLFWQWVTVRPRKITYKMFSDIINKLLQ